MRVSRLYIDQALNVGGHIDLNDDAAHYIRTVLRLKQADAIVLFNGRGGEYLGHFSEISRKRVAIAVEHFVARDVESVLSVTLGLGISRGDRMDWAVQKAVELGVASITPLLTERCVTRLDSDKKQQRCQHWQNIAQHAAEQCGRTRLAAFGDIAELPDWMGAQYGLRVFLDPHGEQTLADLQPEDGKLTLLSGPEGGFSERERELARAAGFVPVRMGPRILRSETAALSALAAVQTLWGDMH